MYKRYGTKVCLMALMPERTTTSDNRITNDGEI